MEGIILPAAVAPPISWFARTIGQKVILDFDHPFEKQTFRNRYLISTANGPLLLTIPLKKWDKGSKFKEIEVSYTERWQNIHSKSISTAYKNAAYYEHILDILLPVYSQRINLLSEVCEHTLQAFFKIIGINTLHANEEINDDYNSHNFEKDIIKAYSYHQIFALKNGFINNCSIIDLLMNEGRDATLVLKNCMSNIDI